MHMSDKKLPSEVVVNSMVDVSAHGRPIHGHLHLGTVCREAPSSVKSH